jgi:hypothetical protein
VAAGAHAENSIEAITSNSKTFGIAFLVHISHLHFYLTRVGFFSASTSNDS